MRLLERAAGRDDLGEQVHHRLRRQRAGIAARDPPQHLGLALGPIDRAIALQLADAPRQLGALVHQREELDRRGRRCGRAGCVMLVAHTRLRASGGKVAHHQHALDRGELPMTCGGHRAVHIHQRVGHVALGLVQHVVDVEPGAAPSRWRSARACWARWRWRCRPGRATRASITTSGKFTALRMLPCSRIIAHLIGHHHRAVVLGLAGGGAEVRQRHDRRVAVEALAGKVAHVVLQALGRQRLARPRRRRRSRRGRS